MATQQTSLADPNKTMATQQTYLVDPEAVTPHQSVWARFIERFRTLLRSVGLGILTYLKTSQDEPPKALINSSRKLALARCAIHIIPTGVSLALVIVNLRGHFIGSELEGTQGQDSLKLGMLQICAKLQVRQPSEDCEFVIADMI